MNALGVLRIDVLQQVGRSNHFAIFESWRDNAALEAHRTSSESRKLDEVLQATRIGPVDERLLSPIGAPSATVSSFSLRGRWSWTLASGRSSQHPPSRQLSSETRG